VVLWAEAKEEECQGNGTAKSRSWRIVILLPHVRLFTITMAREMAGRFHFELVRDRDKL